MRFFGRFRFWGRNPLTIVELIIGIFSMVGGLYVLTPLLTYSTSVNGASSVITLLGNPVAIGLYGLAYLISGFLIVLGVSKRNYRLRSIGLFFNIMCRSYGLIGTFIVQGLLPLTWLSSLIVLMIAIVCYVAVRGFIIRGMSLWH